jgi:hypothetical protein
MPYNIYGNPDSTYQRSDPLLIEDPLGSALRGFNNGLQTSGVIRQTWRDQDKLEEEDRQRQMLNQPYDLNSLPGVNELPPERKVALMNKWENTNKTLRDAMELGKQLNMEREMTTGIDADRARSVNMQSFDIKSHPLFAMMPKDLQEYADSQQEIFGRTKEGAQKALDATMQIPKYKDVIVKATMDTAKYDAETARAALIKAQSDPNVDPKDVAALQAQYKVALNNHNSLTSGIEMDAMKEWAKTIKDPRIKRAVEDAFSSNDVAFIKEAYKMEKGEQSKEKLANIAGEWGMRHVQASKAAAGPKQITQSQANMLERQLASQYLADPRTGLASKAEKYRRMTNKEPTMKDIMTTDQLNGYNRLLSLGLENFSKGKNAAQAITQAIADDWAATHPQKTNSPVQNVTRNDIIVPPVTTRQPAVVAAPPVGAPMIPAGIAQPAQKRSYTMTGGNSVPAGYVNGFDRKTGEEFFKNIATGEVIPAVNYKGPR